MNRTQRRMPFCLYSNRQSRSSTLAFVLALLTLPTCVFAQPVNYERDVKSLLKNKCFACHGRVKQEAGLRLDAGKLVLQGGEDGPVIVPGVSDESRLIARVASKNEDKRMPPEGTPLSVDQIKLLRVWIDQGANFPTDEVVLPTTEEHWSFQPVRQVSIPNVKSKTWPLNPIDRFVLAKLEQRGWHPNGQAKPHALLRRVYLDLIGLPPSIAEQEAFLSSPTPDAFERLIRELLSRKGYGERYARHWLDVVRYADSNGYERDAAKPEVWRYRDYVIRSFSEDKPFDRFVMEQLAGDELLDANTETMIATGFNRLGPWDDEPADFDVDRFDQLDDLVNTTSQAFLGLTMGCARCHDHKFDPLTQREYYSMVAVFNPLTRSQDGRKELTRLAAPPSYIRQLEARDQSISDLRRQIAKASDQRERAQLEESIASLTQQTPDVPEGYFMHEPSPKPPVTHVLLRGSPKNIGEKVEPAVPAILVETQPKFLEPDEFTTRRRLSLARWITDENNPLTSRVIVNRVWQWHFGEGLVRTPNDFGLLGEPASHPELLDYLAYWFVHEANWSLKDLHYMIMTSRTYQMSRERRDDYASSDPDNRLLWRRSYHRLEVEAIRDSMLFVSGQLNRKMYGPPMYPYVPRDALLNHADKTKIWPEFNEQSASRRTVYAFIKRSLLVPMLEVLDLCDTTRTFPKRNVTTVPTQALTLYNGEFVNRQARHMAERLRREAGEDTERQITHAWRLAFCRMPTESESSTMLTFYRDELVGLRAEVPEPASDAEVEGRALVQLCRVILNLNEFVYPD